MFLIAAALWATVIANANTAIPRLEMQQGDKTGICSAVVFEIDAEHNAAALTAAHCVEHGPNTHFNLTANDRHAEVYFFNEILDLAVIRFRAHHETALTIAPVPPKAGEEVAVLGYAFGVEEPAAQFGHVSQSRNKETKSIWLDAMTIFGDSGGAVIDDQGRLVAINSHFYSGGLLGQSAHISAAVGVEQIDDFIDAYHRKLKEDAKHK